MLSCHCRYLAAGQGHNTLGSRNISIPVCDMMRLALASSCWLLLLDFSPATATTFRANAKYIKAFGSCDTYGTYKYAQMCTWYRLGDGGYPSQPAPGALCHAQQFLACLTEDSLSVSLFSGHDGESRTGEIHLGESRDGTENPPPRKPQVMITLWLAEQIPFFPSAWRTRETTGYDQSFLLSGFGSACGTCVSTSQARTRRSPVSCFFVGTTRSGLCFSFHTSKKYRYHTKAQQEGFASKGSHFQKK